MTLSTRKELVALITGLLDEQVCLHEDTSLIKAGLLDSFALLQLAQWISDQSGTVIDLGTIDVSAQWDTILDIERFLRRAQKCA